MPNVFEIYSEKFNDTVTVFARDASEACGLFVVWREAHAPDTKNDVVDIVQLSERDLAERPQLALAALVSGPGIGAWLGHRSGWVSCDPQGEMVGSIAPPKTDVGCYVFVSKEYGNVYVFEETRARAIGIFHVFSINANGCEAEEYNIVEVSAWRRVGGNAGR